MYQSKVALVVLAIFQIRRFLGDVISAGSQVVPVVNATHHIYQETSHADDTVAYTLYLVPNDILDAQDDIALPPHIDNLREPSDAV